MPEFKPFDDGSEEQARLLMRVFQAQLFERVWAQFQSDPARLERVVEAIADKIVSDPYVNSDFVSDAMRRVLESPEMKERIHFAIRVKLEPRIDALAASVAEDAVKRLVPPRGW